MSDEPADPESSVAPPACAAAPGAPAGGRAAGGRPRIAPSRFVAYTWSRHWPAEALMGLSAGILSFVAFSLQRSLGAPQWTSQYLVVLGQGLWILAPAWPPLLSRLRKQETFVWIGIFSRGPLLRLALASVAPIAGRSGGWGIGDWGLLFGTFLLANNLDAVYTPHRNALIRANYPLDVRGRIYGLVALVSGVCSMLAALGVGHLLDHDPTVVRWIFPVAAVLGFGAHLLMARIRWRHEGPRVASGGAGGLVAVRVALAKAWRATGKTLKEDKGFRDFEIGFMLYGMGLLSGTPLIVSRFAQDPTFSTSDWAWADRFILPATQLLFVWIVGRMSDRVGVVRVAAMAFAGLIPFFLVMCLVSTPLHLWLAYVLYGACMSGVNIPWALGPLLFAPRGEAHHYMAVHVAWCGVRSALAPLLGLLVQNALTYEAALIVSAAFEVAAFWWMLSLARRVPLTT